MKKTNLTEHNDLCVGIDLGTTNSVLSIINVKPNKNIVSKVVDVPRGVDLYNAVTGDVKVSKEKRTTLPSCVYYRQEKEYEPMVGDFAKGQYPLRPHLVAKSIKSQMGNPLAEGLAAEVPDKTPAEISSRILKHMIKEASKIYRCEINDAVITVPANFDSAMCKATRDAAELAGIKVKNSDGTERPVLLSEPNAVIYDLINQIHNGEIPGQVLDLTSSKRVLVFDLGGGTLDITMHEIKRRENNEEVLEVDEIATNRYTLLGGDDFDEELAKEMYKRYIAQYAKYPEVAEELRRKKKIIMPQLRTYAEQLKLDVNERCGEEYDSDSAWDDWEDEKDFSVGGNISSVGYSYDDTFTQEEIERVLSVFMAEELVYEDYKRIDKITNTRNIIYPVLDVLKKAAEKLGVEDVSADAVIVNGGMSKFYMVTDRLEKFFGFEPIVALDPDQAVARGAAVYHYYLHQYEELQDNMKLLGDAGKRTDLAEQDIQTQKSAANVPGMTIQWGKRILNDSLYLGVKNGAVEKIIPTGAELPYDSEVMTGFKIEPGQNIISIPIKSRNLDGTYRTIASGNITFKKQHEDGAYVAFRVHMGSNKVITMRAWTSGDEAGEKIIEKGYVEIAIQKNEKTKGKAKFMAPSGSRLQPKEEINNLLQLCENFRKLKNPKVNKNIPKRIAASVVSICNAGNKDEFADEILRALVMTNCTEARMRLFTISRKMCPFWNASQKKRLADVCMNQIDTELLGFAAYGLRVSANIEAVYALSECADAKQLSRLSALHDSRKYVQACLYTHAKTHTEMGWIQKKFLEDAAMVQANKRKSNIQFSARAIGVAYGEGNNSTSSGLIKDKTKVVRTLCALIPTEMLSAEELTSCILALGCICDTRNQNSGIENDTICIALDTIDAAEAMGGYAQYQAKACGVARKMIQGIELEKEEEEYLLTKLEG